MASIKPIEARSVHQIQSGQVIVDLCSVVKELVENGLDAGATSLEVRFKNYGLDAIEVQDNGGGISPSNWDALALKHHTSKLASYDDLSSLETFGFRGEALSSLCALAKFYIVTALPNESPKGNRLDFELSGKLKCATLVAAQTGTIACVEGLFEQLPVRRKELAKNIKKEYGKALGLLHAYACIGTNVKFTVKSSLPKGKNALVFATRGNPTTRENIVNVYGAKTLSALLPLDLRLGFLRNPSQRSEAKEADGRMTIRGHVSRPVFGEGRQTPDRQMFFVNGRPCGLPQIAKAFNEVYKFFNVSQSPFVFADLAMDTNSYDVNVSPDKRTIMLHDSAALVESLKNSLTELFEQQQHTVPQSQIQGSRLPAYTQLSLPRNVVDNLADSQELDTGVAGDEEAAVADRPEDLGNIPNKAPRTFTQGGESPNTWGLKALQSPDQTTSAEASLRGNDHAHHLHIIQDVVEESNRAGSERIADIEDESADSSDDESRARDPKWAFVRDTAQGQQHGTSFTLASSLPKTSIVQSAFDRMRPNRPSAELATITVGDKTMTTVVGGYSQRSDSDGVKPRSQNSALRRLKKGATQDFTLKLKEFAASASPAIQHHLDDSVENSNGVMGSDDQKSDSEPSPSGDGASSALQEEGSDTASLYSKTRRSPVPAPDSVEEDAEIQHKKAQDSTVAELIRAAEDQDTSINAYNIQRTKRGLKTVLSKDSTISLQLTLTISTEQIQAMKSSWERLIKQPPEESILLKSNDDKVANEEERLTLTLSKTDFSRMHIVGQFNLGFILAVRIAVDPTIGTSSSRVPDELFIVDQHASDEKFNFEKLQEETVVGSQRLVCPKPLELTAVEEEILMENISALEKNGFLVSVNTSGDEPIGQRCTLNSIPLSKQAAFGLDDLEELLHLLAESPTLSPSSTVPRPSKVRKMFAMRACRSSIMIGKPLTEQSMRSVVAHMGELDKPWNCPHGRPTMRHLTTLNTFDTWKEGDGINVVLDNSVDQSRIWNTCAW